GADAITWQGDVYNKVGSGMIAETAQDLGVPVYVCTDSWKLDPKTRDGKEITVEERGPDEVWEDPPEDVTVRNPAFEIVISDHIDGLVTELGTVPPDRLSNAFSDTYPEILE
ncbi:MAG: hypothetical protein SVU32_05095, partial [Candidatus Nanohaloarchaea archaeon]|nr:hypothetical protein [Candidatus Nanohaloarchaea archaeon]